MKKLAILILALIMSSSIIGCGNTDASLRSKILDTEWVTETGSRLNFYRGGIGSHGGVNSFKWDVKDGAVATDSGTGFHSSYVYTEDNGVEKLIVQTADGPGKEYSKVK